MNILIADGDAKSLQLLESTLAKWGYGTLACTNGINTWQVLQEDDAPQLAIVDSQMEGVSGLEICRRLRRVTSGNLRLRTTSAYTYIMLLVAKGRRQQVIEGLNAGADDCMLRPLDFDELQVRLRNGRRIIELQSALMAAQEELRAQTTRDALTQLHNRKASMETLAHELGRARRSSVPVSIIMFDLDHFKRVNDAYGQMVGDKVLCETARRLQTSLRGYDIVARYGGEEFLVVLPGCSTVDAVAVAEKLRARLSDVEIVTRAGPLTVRASGGVASTETVEHADAETLVQAAENALYRAKHQGRDMVVATTSPP